MAFQITSLPFKLTPEDMGRPDLVNALSKGMNLGYQPAMTRAEIFNKTVSPLATIASNPLLWSIMSEDQQRQISNMIGNMVNQSGYGQQTGGGGGFLSNAASAISNLFGGGNGQGGQAQSMTPEGQPTNQQLQPTNNQPPINTGGSPIPNARGTDLSPTNFNQQAGKYNLPGTTGSVNPLGVAKAQQAGLETTATTEASGVTDKWNTRLAQGKNGADQATNIQNNLDKVMAAFPKLEKAEKGPAGGRFVALSTAAQDVDQGSMAIADSLAAAQQSGHITQADRQIYGGMKPGRYSTDENMAHQSQFITGLNMRLNQYTPFMIMARSKGLSPEMADAAWQYYVSKTPIYDTKTQKANPKIMDWEDYLESQKLLEALSPRARKAAEKEALNNAPAVSNAMMPNQPAPQVANQPQANNIEQLSAHANQYTEMVSPDGKQIYDVPNNMVGMFQQNKYKINSHRKR